MKKKIQKSLKLNRETLASLDHSDLREAMGAALTQLPNCSVGCFTVGAVCVTAMTCGMLHTECVGW